MSLPFGYKYLKSMARYPIREKRKAYINDYGEDLEKKYDRTDKTSYKKRVFCRDCMYFKVCKESWQDCPIRAEALRIIRRK